jgi:hypothetical protein
MPPQSAEQLFRRMAERFNADGIGAMGEEFFDAQVEYHDDAVWPGGGAHIGRPAVVARFEEVIEVLGIRELALDRVVEGGEQLAWVLRASGQSPGADVPNEHRWGYTGRIVGGKLAYFRAYYNAEEALEAIAAVQ